MAREFTTDDAEKPVVTAEGTRVGTISEVRDGRARVTPTDDESEGLTDKIKSMLGWDDADETHELRREHVDAVDDEVRLRRP
ncbi:hypothetical protein [Halegenticoccus soli]|uniref:hypothetical protein n=1 Tax=Halegenticoccus soli TaxID=1985678 RepID=UPI000C6DDCD4|nr:hypothetical protein [Halegenticoccus soli]